MNSTRLFILGALAQGGAMHGHQIKRIAQTDRAELWTSIKSGALYGALHRLEAEGAIRAVRSEQDGNRPERTIYEITEEGLVEFRVHRDSALRWTTLSPDAVDLALQYTQDLAEEGLRSILEDRRQSLATQVDAWGHLQEAAAPHLAGLERVIIRHTEMRLKAELAWHDELLRELPKLLAEEHTE